MIDNKVIEPKIEKIGDDEVTNWNVLKTANEIPGKDSKITEVLIRYSYEWRVPSKERDSSTSRQFCKDLMAMRKLYTRYEIEMMSERFGYSVWDRCGGFWNNNGTIEYKCRHQWVANIVKRKK